MSTRSGPQICLEAASREELYDLASDPFERVNLAGDRVQQTRALSDRHDRLLAARTGEGPAETQSIDEETREALRSLDYVQ